MAALPVTTARALLEADDIDDIIQFNNQKIDNWMAGDIFDNDFVSFIDKTHNEIDSDLKIYANLTITRGQIRVQPGFKCGLTAVLQ